jgi:hypothetical protein
LAEEAGGRLLTYTPFALLRCHSRATSPYGPHLPYPDFDCLYGYLPAKAMHGRRTSIGSPPNGAPRIPSRCDVSG